MKKKEKRKSWTFTQTVAVSNRLEASPKSRRLGRGRSHDDVGKREFRAEKSAARQGVSRRFEQGTVSEKHVDD
jgi:hypothetical protein